jgi:hypothetical protein
MSSADASTICFDQPSQRLPIPLLAARVIKKPFAKASCEAIFDRMNFYSKK